MAGIGFELKKLYKEQDVFSAAIATVYASAVTVGPTVLMVLALNIMYQMPAYTNMSYQDKDLLGSTILYALVFSLILVAPVNIILSRYMADKIYEEDYGSIYGAVEKGNAVVACFVCLLGLPFSFAMYRSGGLPPYYILIAYVLFAGVAFTYYYMSIIVVLKEYQKITFSFLGCLALGVFLVYALTTWWTVSIRDAILAALATSFSLISALLMDFVRRSLGSSSVARAGDLLEFSKRHLPLILSNLFYVLGFYIHMFVFWFLSDFQITVANVFICAPTYDLATCLAMLSNISVQVVFVVKVETDFHAAYKTYGEALIGAGGGDVRKAKRNMIETLRDSTIFIVQVQCVNSILVYLVAMVFLPKLGIEGLVLSMYPVLSVAYLVLYLVQAFMIYLFYLDDFWGAMGVSLVLVAGVLAGSLVCVRLPPAQAGLLGVSFGALCGFTAAFFRVRSKIIHLDQHIFGRGRIVKLKKSIKPNRTVTVYSFQKGGKSK